MDATEAPPEGIPINGEEGTNALRFEDLTIDDDLPLLDRVVRYCRSGIALQRLVHVKMLAETAETVGTTATIQTLVPLLNPLVSDPESIIRQHVASQLLPLSVTCMLGHQGGPMKPSIQDLLDNPSPKDRTFNERGYKLVTSTLVTHMNTLLMDSDVDVRRSASEALAGLALQIIPDDVAAIVLPIPMRLAHQQNSSKQQKSSGSNMENAEELRISASNLLAELAGAAENGQIPKELVKLYIMPTVLSLCEDGSFRVRRSATQALPRVLGGSTLELAQDRILPTFTKLSRDDMYRVRKSTGECLVDMSRSLMLVAARAEHEEDRKTIKDLRRKCLIPIAVQHLGDSNKFVRHGMMQFLGPFIASFYPLDEGDRALHTILPGGGTSDSPLDSTTVGIGAQFFPHASSMVSRLNSSSSSTTTAPTPTPASLNQTAPEPSEMEQLQQALPQFLQANRLSILSLRAVVAHRRTNPPDQEDLTAVISHLMKHFVGLSKAATGDDNTDAEMRVYCAYSFPAVVLLLGPENWEGMLRDCFMSLVSPNPNTEPDKEKAMTMPPLPVKRCLASSLHTVAHILGPSLAAADVMPIFREQFFLDADDSVRLNVIRNFPWMLSLLPPSARGQYLSMWSNLVKGEEILSAFKRSATNPMLLNWRQRDYVSRSMPDMIGLVAPSQVQDVLWPVIRMLLSDSVSLVREDASWCIPLLLKVYAVDERSKSWMWSTDVCKGVIAWLKDTILGADGLKDSGKGNFSQRQLYCRICAAVGLALRFADIANSAKESNTDEEEMKSLDQMFHAMLHLHGSIAPEGKDVPGPYQALTSAERQHLKRLLVNEMLPPALEMKVDRVTNVRLTLMKILQIMPEDVKKLDEVSEVLQELEDEVATWESFNGGSNEDDPAASVTSRTSRSMTGTASTTISSTSSAQPSQSTTAASGTSDESYPMDEGPAQSNNKPQNSKLVQNRVFQYERGGGDTDRTNRKKTDRRPRKDANRENNSALQNGNDSSLATI